MKQALKEWKIWVYAVLLALLCNSYFLVRHNPVWLFAILPLFFYLNVTAGHLHWDVPTKRLRFCLQGGVLLLLFSISALCSILWHGLLAADLLPHRPALLLCQFQV